MINIPYSPSRLDSTRYLLKTLPKYFKKKKNLIDIGCGKLYFFELLKDLNFKGNYLGVDIEPKKPQYSKKGVKTQIQKINILSFNTNKKFDVAVCLWVLEHIKKDNLVIKKISKIVDKGGIAIVAVPSVWSWPFEFGRHGWHYYRKSHLLKSFEDCGFVLLEKHNASGPFGFVFMLAYSWPRYLFLVPLLVLYLLFKTLKLTNKRWQVFSSDFVRNSFYKYHKYKMGIDIHNFIVDKITALDNSFKILPASYILILKKK